MRYRRRAQTGATPPSEYQGGETSSVSTHDTREPYGAFLVTKEDIAHFQGAILAVQGREGLAFPGLANDQVAALNIPLVIGVNRVIHLKHDIVRHIDNQVDGPHADGLDPLPQPRGRRRDADVFDGHSRESSAAVSLDLDFDVL